MHIIILGILVIIVITVIAANIGAIIEFLIMCFAAIITVGIIGGFFIIMFQCINGDDGPPSISGCLFKQAAGTKTFTGKDGKEYKGRDKLDGTPDNRFDKTIAQAQSLSEK